MGSHELLAKLCDIMVRRCELGVGRNDMRGDEE